MPGTLVMCATPIGNLSDAPPRLREALAAADIVYCEDTRRSGKLMAALGVKVRLRSYFVANEDARAVELAEHLQAGKTVALITDAGVPAVADPGLSAVVAAVGAGATVTVVPGPSAVTAAVAVSGLPSERFVFEGFLPRKQEQRTARLEELAGEPRTMVFFVAASRAATELAAIAEVCGHDRDAVVARELTKLHEEVWRGTVSAAAVHYADKPPKGELTVVVAGAPESTGDLEAAVALVERFVADGVLFSEAVKRATDAHGVRRRLLYEAALRRLDSDAGP
ncbi:MAG: 16S rRNA (cytidine(1402)-2'-O)-methyltransferase [Acidimicrobiia bacterium]|nr:16S rRNA (cytidine(1402)-2'-O)-methyltransferase [Acidimicrobiia bacterium]